MLALATVYKCYSDTVHAQCSYFNLKLFLCSFIAYLTFLVTLTAILCYHFYMYPSEALFNVHELSIVDPRNIDFAQKTS